MQVAQELLDSLKAKCTEVGLTIDDNEANSFLQQIINSPQGSNFTSSSYPVRAAYSVWQTWIADHGGTP